jgi:hypothetical protein
MELVKREEAILLAGFNNFPKLQGTARSSSQLKEGPPDYVRQHAIFVPPLASTEWWLA